MPIHLIDRHFDDNLMAFALEQSLQSLSMCCSFQAVSRRFGSCQFDFTRLFLSLSGSLWSTQTGSLVSLVYLDFGLPARFFLSANLEEVLSAFFARVSSGTVNSELAFQDARNLNCLYPLPYAPYTNNYSLANSSFQPVSLKKVSKKNALYFGSLCCSFNCGHLMYLLIYVFKGLTFREKVLTIKSCDLHCF